MVTGPDLSCCEKEGDLDVSSGALIGVDAGLGDGSIDGEETGSVGAISGFVLEAKKFGNESVVLDVVVGLTDLADFVEVGVFVFVDSEDIGGGCSTDLSGGPEDCRAVSETDLSALSVEDSEDVVGVNVVLLVVSGGSGRSDVGVVFISGVADNDNAGVLFCTAAGVDFC